MRSITWDQGTEMARHLATTDKLGAAVYFCDSRSPWQRGSNANTNGLLRDYFFSLQDRNPEMFRGFRMPGETRPPRFACVRLGGRILTGPHYLQRGS